MTWNGKTLEIRSPRGSKFRRIGAGRLSALHLQVWSKRAGSVQPGLGAARTGAAHLPSPGQCHDKFPPRARLDRHRGAPRLLDDGSNAAGASLLTCNFWRYSLHSRIDTAARRARPEKSSTPLSPPQNDKRCARYILAKRL